MPRKISKELSRNQLYLENMFSHSIDLYSKPLRLFGINCCLFYFEGLSSLSDLSLAEYAAVSEQSSSIMSGEELFVYMKQCMALPAESTAPEDYEQVRQFLTAGASVLFIEGCSKALAFSTQHMQFRSIQEPSGEGNIRAPREGFSEILRTNISLVRRLMRTESLVAKTSIIGEKTKTEVALLYDRKLVNPALISKVENQLKRIKLPILFDASYLAPFLYKGPFSFFHHVGYTERPAVACAKLCEGKLIILVGGTPFAMILPYFFNENFESLDDYSSKAYFASFIRCIKYIAFLVAILLPGMFVSIAGYTPELFPPEFLYFIIAEDMKTPLPIFMEMSLTIVLIEIIREAGLRLPKSIGHTVGLVSALIIGDTAVKAGILSVSVVITAALSTISMLCIPSLYEPSTLLRLLFVLAAGLLGPIGVTALLFITILNICSINAFGIPFSSPFSPLGIGALRDGFIRLPWTFLAKKPFSIRDLPGGVKSANK